MLPHSFQELIFKLSKLSGVGEKTAQRYAFEILEWKEKELQEFSEIILNLKRNIQKCKQCNNLCESEVCDICSDASRDEKTICVVSSVKDLIAIEKTNQYFGKYYVLNGLISIHNGIYPEDLEIDLFVENCINQNVEEVILALNLNIDGETTALYISKKLEFKNIITSRIASGLPIGGNIEYADELTLYKALEGRKKI